MAALGHVGGKYLTGSGAGLERLSLAAIEGSIRRGHLIQIIDPNQTWMS